MNTSILFSSLLRDKYLSDIGIQEKATKLINNLDVDAPLPSDIPLIELVHAKDIECGLPTQSVIRLLKKEYVDLFFETGELQLGTLKYYSHQEDEGIGDKAEGSMMLVVRSFDETSLLRAVSGFNYYVLCCCHGEPTEECREKFKDKDSSFEIVNVEGFAQAISSKLNSIEYKMGKCTYHDDRVLLLNTPKYTSHIEIILNFTTSGNRSV